MTVIGLCVAGLLAVIPAAAQANEVWELNKSGWTTTFPHEVLASSGSLAIIENSGGTQVGKCKVTDDEEIWNAAVGEDEMIAFNGLCKGGPFPCVGHEPVNLTARGLNWESELHKVGLLYYDEFSGMELEVECVVSTKKATYEEVFANPIDPQVLTDKLKFNGAASGEMETPGHTFYFTGVDKLKAPAGYTKVRAK